MPENDWVTGEVAVNIGGLPLKMQMTVPANPVKPQRMLPIFHQMANALVGISVNAIEDAGAKISCKAGCGACCRQPVPISEIEVYQIAELVKSMPEPRRTIVKKRFADGSEHFNQMGWFNRLNEHFEPSADRSDPGSFRKATDVILEYFYEDVPCPFLEDESCSIHEARPIACREYLVTSPAENCAKPTAETVRVVDLLIKPLTTVRHLGSTGNMHSEGFLTLIRALELAETYPERFVEKTGERWMADFFSHLSKTKIPKKGVRPAKKGRTQRRPKRKRE
jgi:Fe-S-cluster containining protein